MKTVLLLLPRGFEAYEASVFTDVFGFAKTGGFKVELVSAANEKIVPCAYGYNVIPNKLVNELDLDLYDALALPGGRSEKGFYKDGDSQEILNVINHFIENKKYIATICVGILLVAKRDLLIGYEATTYPGKRQKELSNHGIVLSNLDIVKDRNLISCSAPKHALDVAFALLEDLTNKKSANMTRKWFGFKN